MSEMILQQMIADAYTDARIIWDQNETKTIQENDDVRIRDPPSSNVSGLIVSIVAWFVWAKRGTKGSTASWRRVYLRRC